MALEAAQSSPRTAPTGLVPSNAPWTGAAIWVLAALALIAQGFDGLAISVGVAGALFLAASLQTGPPTVGHSALSRFAIALAAAALIAAELQIAATGIDIFVQELPSALMLGPKVASFAGGTVGAIAATLAATFAALALALAPTRVATQATATSVFAAIVLVAAACLAGVLWRDGITALVSLPAVADLTSIEARLLDKRLADPTTLRAHIVPFLKTDAINFIALAFLTAIGLASLGAALARPGTGRSPPRSSMIIALLLVAALPAIASSGKRDLMATVESGIKVTVPPAWLTSQLAAGTVELCGKAMPPQARVSDACGRGFGRDGLVRWQDISFQRDGALFAAIQTSSASQGLTNALTIAIVAIAILGAALTAHAAQVALVAAVVPARSTTAANADRRPADTADVAPSVPIVLTILLTAAAGASSGLADIGTLVALAAGIAAVAMVPRLLAAMWTGTTQPTAGSTTASQVGIALGIALVVGLTLAPKLAPTQAFELSGSSQSAPPAVARRLATLASQAATATDPAQRASALRQSRRIIDDRITWLGLKPAAAGLIGVFVTVLITVLGFLVNTRH